MSQPCFIVGTGRCGSTMLSNMIREHPKILSISEFFGYVAEGQRTKAFTPEPLDGRGFWNIITNISPLSLFTSVNRLTIPESLYDRDVSGTRYSWDTGVPAFLVTTLPHLSDDPDKLFGLLESEIPRWPVASIAEHYTHLFAWLAARFEKASWVERSGASLLFAAELNAAFPEAKFVHIVRDGRDAAMSMQHHWGLRIVVGLNAIQGYLGVDPVQSTDRSRLARVPPALRPLLPENLDAEAVRNFDLPLTTCGQFWAQQVAAGLPILQALPRERLLTLRYEDFLVDAKTQLDAIAAFVGEEFVDPDWSAHCAGKVRAPRSTWRDLRDQEAQALTEACRPGFELLAAAGLPCESGVTV